MARLTRRLGAFAVLALALAAGTRFGLAARQGPPPTPTGTGLILGQVVDASNKQPIPDAAVTLVLNGRPQNNRPVATDTNGHFLFRNLAAGTYSLEARRRGFVDGVSGATRVNGTPRPIVLNDGERVSDAKVMLWKTASISGVVTDEAGDPMVGLEVYAYRRTLTAGVWRFGSYTSSLDGRELTDDRGMFRFPNLTPGDFVVVVPSTVTVVPTTMLEALEGARQDPSTRAASQAITDTLSAIAASGAGIGNSVNRQLGSVVQTLTGPNRLPPPLTTAAPAVYLTQFFPNAPSATRARVITLASGEERTSIDFSMRPVRTHTISGVVIGSNGPAAGIPIALAPADSVNLFSKLDTAATISNSQGEFTLMGVPSGDFTLRAMLRPRPAQVVTQIGSVMTMQPSAAPVTDPTLWANATVSVGDSDVTGVSMTLSVGARIGGRVVFEGASQPPAAAANLLQIYVEGADGRAIGRSVVEDVARLNNGGFLTPGFPAGQYFLRVPGAPLGWTVKSITSADRDLLEAPVDLGARDVTDVVITLADRATEVAGSVKGANGQPAAGSIVLMFPTDTNRWTSNGLNPQRFLRAGATRSGFYSLSAPAGEYFIVALADDPPGEWRDPATLGGLAKTAARVRLAEGQKHTQDLTLTRLGLPVPANGSAIKSFESPALMPDIDLVKPHGPFAAEDGSDVDQARDNGTARVVSGTAAIAGRVVNDLGQPVRRVVVTANCQDPRVRRTTVTDDSGAFLFDALPSGRYSVVATKPSFITARYGASKPDRTGTPIAIADGERRTLSLTLIRGAAITGVVRDEHGQPMPGVRPELFGYEYFNGERVLGRVTATTVQSDDRGVYRAYGLPAGEYFLAVQTPPPVGYYVSLAQTTAADVQAALAEIQASTRPGPLPASNAAPPPARAPVVGYSPVYYPAAISPNEASKITIKAGEQREGLDLTIRLVPFATIIAHVAGSDGKPPVTLQGRLADESGGQPSTLGRGMPSGGSDGTLRLSSVPPGRYTLAIGGTPVPTPARGPSGVIVMGANPAIGMPEWAMVPITVDGQDLELSVTLERAKTVSGTVVLEGDNAPANFAGVSIGLSGPKRSGVSTSVNAKPVSSSGAFTLDTVVPGSLRVFAALPRGWMLKSATINGQDVADHSMEITTDIANVSVVCTNRVSTLTGTLQTAAGQAAPDYHVIVFPSDKTLWSVGARRIVAVRPSTDGRFTTPALPSGEYLVAAVVDVEDSEWLIPAFLETLVAGAVKATLVEGQVTQQVLRIAR